MKVFVFGISVAVGKILTISFVLAVVAVVLGADGADGAEARLSFWIVAAGLTDAEALASMDAIRATAYI